MFRKKDMDEEIEIAAQRVLLGWKAAGQPIKIIVQDRKASSNFLEKNQNSLDSLLSLANSLA